MNSGWKCFRSLLKAFENLNSKTTVVFSMSDRTDFKDKELSLLCHHCNTLKLEVLVQALRASVRYAAPWTQMVDETYHVKDVLSSISFGTMGRVFQTDGTLCQYLFELMAIRTIWTDGHSCWQAGAHLFSKGRESVVGAWVYFWICDARTVRRQTYRLPFLST